MASPPDRDLLIFDGDCGFCRTWIARWKALTGDRVEYAPSQEVGGRFPEIPAGAFARSVQLVRPDGTVLSGARAVVETLAAGGRGTALRAYRRVPGFSAAAEAAYGLVARHRPEASALTRALWGRTVERPRFAISSALFLRLLGVVFFIAFTSLWAQVDGLIGSRGILPIAELLSMIPARIGAAKFWLLPTFSWAAPADAALHVQCAAGAALSLVLAAGFAPALCLAAVTALYLSLSVAGQIFFAYQWDYLLVEAGFVALFVAPLSLHGRFGAAGPSRTALLLVRWLVFRLNFASGVVKLSSGDPTWRSLTALDYHYQTQPLPVWPAWYAHAMPAGSHRVSVLLLFAIELVVPFFVFGPRRLRHAAIALLCVLQAAVAVTGNFAFFNLLTIVLCVPLLDDSLFSRFPGAGRTPAKSGEEPRSRRWSRPVVAFTAVLVFVVGAVELSGAFSGGVAWPSPIAAVARSVAPLRIINSYGLFAVMTTTRSEIVVEGSRDGVNWIPYEFPWKPGDVRRRPGFVAPHQPRLDWQMWFAALGTFDQNPWFAQFLARILEGSPPVLALLASNPFPGSPPRFVRATSWDYRFTRPSERRQTGAWWARRAPEAYGPELERP